MDERESIKAAGLIGGGKCDGGSNRLHLPGNYIVVSRQELCQNRPETFGMNQRIENRMARMKVVALTGGLDSPAARFRVRQYIPRLAEHEIDVREYIPFFHEGCGLPSVFKAMSHIRGVIGSHKADLTWIGRELVQGYETFERFLKRPCVMDVDDSLWLNRPFGKYAIPDIARLMDAIVTGNRYLADWFGQYCRKVYILPTAVDLSRYRKRPDAMLDRKEKFTIGWTGLACNYRFLKLIEQPLKQFLLVHHDAELQLIAERPWRRTEIPSGKIRFVRWNRDVEATALQDMSVGIMPLPDNEWTRGKCSFKMLQYMATGLPVVVSPVGMNKEVLEKGGVGFAAASDDEWYGALESFYRDKNLQIKTGNTARDIVEKHFSAIKVADDLADIFRKLVG